MHPSGELCESLSILHATEWCRLVRTPDGFHANTHQLLFMGHRGDRVLLEAHLEYKGPERICHAHSSSNQIVLQALWQGIGCIQIGLTIEQFVVPAG